MPLSGLRVLDLTDRAGALGTRLLGDLGADVVRVEPPGGASLRAVRYGHEYANFNKRCVAIDLGSEAGRARVRRLAEAADVVVDGRPPGASPSLDDLCGPASHAILIRLTPFGETGPRAGWLGTDLVCAARGGMIAVNGDPAEPPLAPFGLAAYASVGLVTATAALLALLARRETGRGSRIDVSVAAAAASMVEHATGLLEQGGRIARRSGALHWTRAFRIGPSRDGHVLASILGDWTSLAEWAASEESGLGELCDARWQEERLRREECDRIFDLLDRWTARRTAEEVAEGAWLRRLPLAPVRRPRELASDRQLAARGFVREIRIGARRLRLPGAPYRLSRTPWRLRLPPAAVGEHDAAVDRDPAWRGRGTPAPRRVRAGSGAAPLAGLVVLDFSWVVAGPVATRVLADHGARVVKVEHPRAADQGARRGGLTGNLNRGKESVALDLSRPSAREVARRLAARADVVIDNFSPRVLESWGLGDEALRSLRTDLVVVHLSGFGRSGPLCDVPSFGPTLQALAGLPWAMRHPGAGPTGWGYSSSDMAAGPLGALATLAALWHRIRTGEGQVVDLAQFEGLVALLGPGVVDALAGRDPDPAGNGSQEGALVPHGVYRAAAEARGGRWDDDRWVAIAVPDDRAWEALARVLAEDGEAWAAAGELASVAGRRAAREEIDRRLGRWTRERSAAEVEARLQRAGVPAGLVADALDLARDPQLLWRGHFARVETPEGGSERVDGVPFVCSDLPRGPTRPGPLLGEHTDAVLRDLAGLGRDEIEALRREEAIL